MIAPSRVAWTLVVFWVAGPAWAESWKVKVRGRQADRAETPVVVELKTPLPSGDYLLQPAENGKPLPAQVFADRNKRYLVTILGLTSDLTAESYTLRPDTKSAQRPPGVALRREGPDVEVHVGERLLTKYLSDAAPKPFYYPVVGPTGVEVTRAYPMKTVEGEDKDHPHQRSLWFTHGNVNGFDFWASDPRNGESPKFGTIKETAKETLVGGCALGLIRTTDDWLGHDGKKVCEDERVVRFYGTKAIRIIDFDITIKATNGPVTFGDTKEGMFGLRVASSMDVEHRVAGKMTKTGGKITNAEGLTDAAAWGKPSAWVDYTGPVQGQTLGIAILNHPDSFRYPTTWHVRTYGLFAANPFGWHDFGQKRSGAYTIPAGESIAFRYRVILHAGDTASAGLPAAFRAFAQPPTVEVQAE
jgi:hypothetical protein